MTKRESPTFFEQQQKSGIVDTVVKQKKSRGNC